MKASAGAAASSTEDAAAIGKSEAATAKSEAATQRLVTVASRIGLHARPAALFTQAAAGAEGHRVTLERADGSSPAADGRSVLAVLALAAGPGERLRLSVFGPDADWLADRLAALVETDDERDPRHHHRPDPCPDPCPQPCRARPGAITARSGNATISATATRSPLAHSGPRFPAPVPRVVAATRGPVAAPTLSAAVA